MFLTAANLNVILEKFSAAISAVVVVISIFTYKGLCQ